MINAIGEATMQQFVRSNYNSETYDKDLEVQKTDKVKKHRPVEKSDDGQKPEMDLKSEQEMKTRNNLEDGQITVESYDESGRLVKVSPPGYLPPGQMA
jgi:nitrogen fixation protein FixH